MHADQGLELLGVDESFDRYARMVRRALGVPVAVVSLVEQDRQVFVGAEGLASPWWRTPATRSATTPVGSSGRCARSTPSRAPGTPPPSTRWPTSRAATMGQMRSTLRALAWAVDDPPSRQVLRLEQAMADLGVEGLATLVYARIEETLTPDGDHVLRWTNAGQPPPLLVRPDGEARFLEDEAGDVMLGVLPDAWRSDNRTEVPPGSTLLLYTDGLVERRGEDLAEGLERLAKSAGAHVALDPDELLDMVLRDLRDGELADDVALLAVRFG